MQSLTSLYFLFPGRGPREFELLEAAKNASRR